ncbi:hypothetical protein PC119_g17141 [Phytophthora cactorum]|nr:hypothetical protein PC119_g17141 [Phytophthora cactorum]
MSDEFNQEGRTFEAGADHLWTAIEKPDGVNAALEIYSINMTSTECDEDDNCYFYIDSDIDEKNITVWNDYITPPGYQNVSFYYRAAMVQGWNKFCFQGGLVVVRAQLPGVVGKDSGNPDLVNATKTTRAESIDYYPTWPGIWMFGNLGRAIFTGSTARIWPFSYNECNDTVFDSQNQRISACDPNPGSGMNPYQGRGAPEIDILEGGGTEISSSMQIGPGMPDDFRQLHDEVNPSCIYGYSCTTTGANNPDVPTAYYEKLRGYQTWYQGMRYGANNLCASESEEIQTLAKINASLTEGITENACTIEICPASFDVNADLGFMDNRTDHWGVNSNGTCFPRMNAYTGAYLCNAGNTASKCTESGGSTSAASSFMYQMDALSSNWGIHLAAYVDWVTYTVEWVTGDDGYVRWEVEGNPLYEIAAATVTNPPQDAAQLNPKKIMIEEPLYIIFNVALSSSWGSKPPNAGTSGCYGDGKDKKTNAICDAFPMKMKIDYVRVYQDTSTMAYGCDPASHPTKQWIEDNIDSYQDFDNLVVEMAGRMDYNQTNELEPPRSESVEEIVDCFLDEEASMLEFLESCEMAQRELVISTTPAEATNTQAGTISNVSPDDIRNYAAMMSASRRATPQTKSWYKRRNEEVLYLRDKVQQLSALLDQLKVEATLLSALVAITPAPELELWKSIATRAGNKARRKRGRKREITRILQSRVTQAFKSLREDPTAPLCLNEDFANLDRFFESIKMHELPCPGRCNNTANSMAESKYVEFLDCYALPFDFKRMDDTTYSLTSDGIEETNATLVEIFLAGTDTKSKSVDFTFCSGSIDVRIVMRKVVRRCALRNQTVFIWRTLIEPEHDSIAMAFRETTRLELRPGEDTHIGPTSVMQSHFERDVQVISRDRCHHR